MNDKTVELLSLRRKPPLPGPAADPNHGNATADANADEEECLAFGYLRGLHDRASSIEFRFANGNRRAFPYSWLGPADYHRSAGILLKFVGDLVYLVLIQGSNLNALVKGAVSLYDRGIQRHRVTWVREMPRDEAAAVREGEVTVQCIHMLSYRNGEEPKDVEWLRLFQDQR